MTQFWLDKINNSRLLIYRGLITFVLIISSSCSEKTISEKFQEKYGSEVTRINSGRVAADQKVKVQVYPPSQEEVNRMYTSEADINKYSYVDVKQFATKKYLPDGDYYQQMRAYNPSNFVRRDLFQVKYDTTLASKFHHIGAEFDGIRIPPEDLYGVKSTLSSKPYIVIGRNSVQKSFDVVNKERKKIDVEASKIIISEQKEALRKGIDITEIAKKEDLENAIPSETQNEENKETESKSEE